MNVTGTAVATNIGMDDMRYSKKTIFDFSGADFDTYNLQINNCMNLVIHQPTIDQTISGDHCIKVENSSKIFIDQANTEAGNNGIFITRYSTECFVYESSALNAENDGITFHATDSGTVPCGNNNVAYNCTGSGDEEGFDITSGIGHYVINGISSSVTGANSIFIGRDAGATVIDFDSPDFKVYITDCAYANIVRGDIEAIALRTGGEGDPPQNVTFYGSPSPTVLNIEDLDLDAIYSEKNQDFFDPFMGWIKNTVDWIEENLR